MRLASRRLLWGARFLLVGFLLHAAGLLFAQTPPTAPGASQTTGRLILQGDAVECLVLAKHGSGPVPDPANLIRLDRPGPSVEIPAGEYHVQEVRLQGGYRCAPPGRVTDGFTGETRETGSFNVSPEKPYVLDVGAPLKPTLKVIREGRTLRVAYSLLDRSGREFWTYVPDDFGCGPVATLSVHCRDRLVGSASMAPFG